MLERVNELLEQFYKDFYDIEAFALKQGIKVLTTTELHVIEAIGTESLTMNELSERLGITMGTATVAINKLSKKDFIDRSRCKHDRRKVFVSLNKNGIEALKYHTEFHKNIIKNITSNLTQEELSSFVNVFDKIICNLKEQMDLVKPDNLLSFENGSNVRIVEIKGTPAVKSYFEQHNIKENSEIKLLESKKENIIISVSGKEEAISISDAKNIMAIKTEVL